MIILKNMDSLTPWAYDFFSHKFLTIFTLLGMHSLFLNWPQIQSGEQLVTLNSSGYILPRRSVLWYAEPKTR